MKTDITTERAIEVLEALRHPVENIDTLQELELEDIQQALDKAIEVMDLVEEASMLVGNPGTNISGSTDLACTEWQRKYKGIEQ